MILAKKNFKKSQKILSLHLPLKIEPALEAIKGENDRILGMISVFLLGFKAIFR